MVRVTDASVLFSSKFCIILYYYRVLNLLYPILFHFSESDKTMSDALLPWIRDYLISAAETYGANIANLPLYPKNKKVQLTQVRTATVFSTPTSVATSG